MVGEARIRPKTRPLLFFDIRIPLTSKRSNDKVWLPVCDPTFSGAHSINRRHQQQIPAYRVHRGRVSPSATSTRYHIYRNTCCSLARKPPPPIPAVVIISEQVSKSLPSARRSPNMLLLWYERERGRPRWENCVGEAENTKDVRGRRRNVQEGEGDRAGMWGKLVERGLFWGKSFRCARNMLHCWAVSDGRWSGRCCGAGMCVIVIVNLWGELHGSMGQQSLVDKIVHIVLCFEWISSDYL